jgi:ATP-dependent exoDNAse (exonuclease V) beta subunit
MRSFDILEANVPIFGPKLLEASAGTGKTFTIEHLYVRLLREGIPLEQILVVTFTRAATRELRMRIRARLVEQHLERTLVEFDHAQIFTIHGFCQRMLSRFLVAPTEAPTRIKMRNALIHALAKQNVLAPEQLGILLARRSMSELCDALLDAPSPQIEGGSFAEDCASFQHALEASPFRSLDVQTEVDEILSQYKKGIGIHELKQQIEAVQRLLLQPADSSAFRTLIYWKGSLFRAFSEEHRKVRVKEKRFSPFFSWAQERLLPLLEAATKPDRLFARLRFEALMEEKGFFSPDRLLDRCCKASRDPEFCAAVQGCYQAVIVDEFQDTDAIQWEMLDRFFGKARAFCLVGDPKQSIYRFRKADLYTYFRARNTMGEENCYSLDTNYRSTPELLSALNDLFCDEHVEPWLYLPQKNIRYPYLPLKAGLATSSDFGDGKKAMQFFCVENSYQYVAAEIARLYEKTRNFRAFAILVKDHREAIDVHVFLQQSGIPTALVNQMPLSRSPAFRLFEEQLDQCADDVPFRIPFRPEFFAIAEALLKMDCASYEQVKRNLRILELEETPHARELQGDAVRILTMHASKGLEFDVVFALGIIRATPTSEEQEEQEAEKLRQLYVALTRAKKRVYAPADPAPTSALGLFFRHSKLGREPEQIIAALMARNGQIGLDRQCEKFCAQKSEQPSAFSSSSTYLPPMGSRMYSYTSLAQCKEENLSLSPITSEECTLHTLPRGPEVGVTIHRIFERIFSEELEPQEVVSEEILLASLCKWEQPVQEMVKVVLQLPFIRRATSIRTEVEFLFADPPNYIKGFIDLLLFWHGSVYILDWKTNWLGPNDAAYTQEALTKAMQQHDYLLQAKLYAEALQRAFPNIPFGGAYYLFLRGVHAKSQGILLLQPSQTSHLHS